ncbi:hypothetical protein BJV78DRAFT_832257 [Lactifluus subvellereus]|nr:hypothetical protein BJV78DRAFT_832257 [Lactifluus subvellereus]
MVNWHGTVILFKDSLALIKLDHTLAGLYIWETVFTAGFELGILTGKRRYRWTIWLYLGTRYTALLGFILFIIGSDSGNVSCRPLGIMEFASAYASWTFASLIIVLRVIAIWNREIFVSSFAVGIWLAGIALHTYSLTTLEPSYNAVLEVCIILNLRKSLVNAVGILVVDILLLVSMLIGLLRYAHRSPNGIWPFLYQQCIIWIALAAVAEVPLVVFLILDLNDAWNGMFTGPTIAILSIGAARMYRSLCQHGCLTDFVSFEPPRVSPGTSTSNPQYRSATHGPIHFAVATQSSGTATTSDAPVFMPADHKSGFVHEATKKKAGYETA